ncbi:MAG: MMPL family transporter [Proteobacteria bacterium]|nr:MMPL family transporter [Pseudomonadota bacterium]
MANEPGIRTRPFEARFGEWVVAARWPIVAVTLILVAVAASGSLKLQFSANYRVFFSQDNPQLLALESLENTYSKNDNVLFLLVPEDRDATSEQALAAAVWLTEQAWRTPYSTRVDSIANFPHTLADGDDLSVSELVDPDALSDADHRSWVRATALADPRIEGNLLARDGGVSAVNVTVELPAEDEAVRIPEVAAFAYGLAEEAKNLFPSVDVRLVGTVMINHAFAAASIDSQITFLPASLAIMALVLGLLIRGLAGVAATGLVIVFSVLVAMGLGGWVGLPFTPPTAPAPTIVLMVAVANCAHLLVTLLQRLRAGDSKPEAIVESLRVNLHPVFLASLTTAIGFLTMNFSEVPPYRHLGTLVAFGVGASFVLSVTFLPALLSLLPVRAPATGRAADPAMASLAEFVVRRRTPLLWGSLAVVLALLAAVPRNELNDVLVHFFDESVEIRQDTDFLDERLSGNTLLEYSLVSPGPGEIADPAFLADISAFAAWYRDQPETRHVTVLSDTFRELNKNMHGDDPAAYRLPASRELASQYLLLYELSLPFGLDLNNRIDVSKSATRMTVTAKTLSSQEVLELHTRAEAWLDGNAPHIVRTESAGAALMFAHIGQRNIQAMLFGTAVAFLGVSMVLIVALRSLRIGLLSLVPNFIPGLMGFGVWGLAVGEVGLALSVVMAMTIGIVVDDTVHFLSKYRRARQEHASTPEDAVRYAFQTVGRAIVTTSAVLVAGFLIFVLSPFLPTAGVGWLASLIIALAVIADFLLLPPLLMALDRRGESGGAGSATDPLEARGELRPAADH